MSLTGPQISPAAAQLVEGCLERLPGLRPGVDTVLKHPLFWSAEASLEFVSIIFDVVKQKGELKKDLQSNHFGALCSQRQVRYLYVCLPPSHMQLGVASDRRRRVAAPRVHPAIRVQRVTIL